MERDNLKSEQEAFIKDLQETASRLEQELEAEKKARERAEQNAEQYCRWWEDACNKNKSIKSDIELVEKLLTKFKKVW